MKPQRDMSKQSNHAEILHYTTMIEELTKKMHRITNNVEKLVLQQQIRNVRKYIEQLLEE